MTRGIISGQIKALSMIVAIEGLIPDRRLSPSATQPAAPPVQADIYESQWRRKQQHQAAGEEPTNPGAVTETRPPAPHVPASEPTPEPPYNLANETSSPSLANPFINPERLNRVPEATGYVFDAVLDRAISLRLPSLPEKGFSRRRR